MRLKTALLPLTMPLLLAACFGSGGGGGGSSSGPLSFTSFDALEPNAMVEATAATSVNYAADVVTDDVQRDGDITVQTSSLLFETGDRIDPNDPSSAPEIEARRLTVNVPDRSALIHNFTEEPVAVGGNAAANRFTALRITDDVDQVTDQLLLNENDALNFLAFGLWELDIGEATIDIGGAAWGALTPLDGTGAMSTPVSATYTGDLIGYNVVETETDIFVAVSTLFADFGENEVTFSSQDTVRLADGEARSNFDIAATDGEIDGNSFSGLNPQLVGNDPGTFVGSFGGNFYGPDAAEVGGWFEIRTDSNSDRYFGSFGANNNPS